MHDKMVDMKKEGFDVEVAIPLPAAVGDIHTVNYNPPGLKSCLKKQPKMVSFRLPLQESYQEI